jgi:hypothetical protein
VANIPGIVVPALGLWLRRRTGSWHALFVLTAALQLTTGMVFGRLAALEDARTLLARGRAGGTAAA